MDPQIVAALTALAVIVIGSLGTLVAVLTERIKRELSENTKITTQARDSANGNLSRTMEQLARTRDLVLGLREVVRERDDRLAYIVARHPEVEVTLRGYKERRQRRATEREEAAALSRFVEGAIDALPETESGTHPAS